ncbi:MAG: dihydroorotate dehydrogenase electron transfer subunit [Lachnospiraceae bacterium]|nr:dihydroorotate dehydrogenase electron transfer subunit [Lachnospiraceae bacterium]
MKIKETCTVIIQERIAGDVYSLWLQTEKIASQARPGQFVSLYSSDGRRLLPRPISLCEIDGARGRLRLVYRVVGKGTKEFSGLSRGDTLDVLGPLGNGFPMEEAAGKKIFLIGGGIGIPPMLAAAQALAGNKEDRLLVMGYRDELFLDKELAASGNLYVATEDGSAGVKGNVLDAIRRHGLAADMIFACGPRPMLRAVHEYAVDRNITCYISMEERMACGVGACLGCVCNSTKVDDHSRVHNKRVCKDGPVFLSTEVEL